MTKKKILFSTVFVGAFLAVTIPVFAFTQRYFDTTNQFYTRVCAPNSPSIQPRDQVLCYLIERSRENYTLDATQSAQITDLQQRVSTLEKLLTPTPSPTPTLLSEDFNGPNLDSNIWEFFSTNGGNYSFDNDSIVVPGGSSMFYIRTKDNPFPTSGPFTAEFGIQFTSPAPSGIGLALGFQQQTGYDPSNIPVSFWEDSASGLNVSRFGLNVGSLGSGIDTNYHIGKIVYDGDKYLVYNDGVLKYTSPSSATAKTIWFGNPYCCSTTWTGLKLDYVKVTSP